MAELISFGFRLIVDCLICVGDRIGLDWIGSDRIGQDLFSIYFSDFFVDDSDPPYVRNLKLQILSCIANESNSGKIIRELHVRFSVCLSSS